MRKWLVLAAFVGVGVLLADPPPATTGQPDEEAPHKKAAELLQRIKALKRQTSFLNLFNGLYLTAKQLEQIIKINEEYQAELQQAMEKALPRLEQAVETMEAWVEALKRGELPKGLMRRAGGVDRLTMLGDVRMAKLKAKYKERLEAVFTDAQKEVIATFKPCVVPPRNLKNPVRAGQAKSAGHAARILEEFRKLPPRRFRARVEHFVKSSVEAYARTHHITEEEIEQEKKRLREIFYKAYQMDDLEFELNKEKLAEELKVRDKAHIIRDQLKELRRELARYQKKARPDQSPVVRWFLNPAMLPVMKMRLKMLRGEKVDPDEGKTTGGTTQETPSGGN